MNNDIIAHHGIKGQKWGIRRFQNQDGTRTEKGRLRYKSTSISSFIARKQNEKVDASFKAWKKGTKNKQSATDAGMKRNQALIDLKTGKGDKKAYRQANREYKKALRSNTEYRRGSVKAAVGKDLSRKYLTEAKRIEKQLRSDPGNKQLKKQYTKLMNAHDIERAKARRAQTVGANRSRLKAGIKRGLSMAVKGAVASVAMYYGARYIQSKGYSIDIDSDTVRHFAEVGSKIFDAYKYVY